MEAKNEGNTQSKHISLTFDDGPSPEYTPIILDVLDKYKAKATFFLIGEKVSKNPEVAKEIVNRGHSIGNHSFYHKNRFPFTSVSHIKQEIEQCNLAIKEAVGVAATLFRPPFGVTNPRIAKAVHLTKVQVIGWSIRSYDTIGSDIDKVVKRVCSKLKPGKIVLLHDDRPNTANILEGILLHMQKNGLKSVRVEEI